MKKLLLILLSGLLLMNAAAQSLRIAVYQYDTNPRIKNLEPLAKHLEQQLHINTSVKSYPTVHDLIWGMQQNKVDLAFISTFGFLLLQAKDTTNPMLAAAALIAPESNANYKTAFVAKSSLPATSLEELKAAAPLVRMAFVAKGSTSGNLVPRLLLSGVGIADPESNFTSVQYAGTHARAIGWLLKDSADVAAMGSAEWDKLDSVRKNSLRVLHVSSEIPLGPVLINKNLPGETRSAIIKVLLRLHQLDPEALGALKAAWTEAKNASKFIAIDDNHYRPYLLQFGSRPVVESIIKSFIN